MHLIELHVKNYRSLKRVTIPIHDLTVFIGENDSGKTSILTLLGLILNGERPDTADYCGYGENEDEAYCVATEIEAVLTFKIPDDSPTNLRIFATDDGLILYRKLYTAEAEHSYCWQKRYKIETLNSEISDKNTQADIDAYLHQLGIEVGAEIKQKSQKIALIQAMRDTAETEFDWQELSNSKHRDLKQYLPSFERYQTLDYEDPTRMVEKTLKEIYASMLYESPDGVASNEKHLTTPLRNLQRQVEERLNEEVSELGEMLRRYNPRIQQISYEPKLDFLNGFRPGQLLIDAGHGLHPLSKTGDGTKRRTLMATIDWDRRIVSEEISNRPRIRAYDEPDTSLHYDAQRKMFEAITAITRETSIQAIICTHSLAMIDRAPAQKINKLTISDDGTISSQLVTHNDKEVEDFLHLLAMDMGITNTMMFFERCYIVVEGQTEENALPILYQRMFGRSMIEDGIRLINLEGNGGRRGLLKLLSKNRQHLTLVLLDSEKHEMQNEFIEAEFAEEYILTNTYFIGNQEFEDAFSDEAWCSCLAASWLKVDSEPWEQRDIAALRTSKKFSTALMELINTRTIEGPPAKKSSVAIEIARHCPDELIPQEICSVFERARSIAQVII